MEDLFLTEINELEYYFQQMVELGELYENDLPF